MKDLYGDSSFLNDAYAYWLDAEEGHGKDDATTQVAKRQPEGPRILDGPGGPNQTKGETSGPKVARTGPKKSQKVSTGTHKSPLSIEKVQDDPGAEVDIGTMGKNKDEVERGINPFARMMMTRRCTVMYNAPGVKEIKKAEKMKKEKAKKKKVTAKKKGKSLPETNDDQPGAHSHSMTISSKNGTISSKGGPRPRDIRTMLTIGTSKPPDQGGGTDDKSCNST